jgi:hypothetical protein
MIQNYENKININISSEYKYNQQQISYTFNRIKELCDNKKLHLNPEYQRDVVWSIDKMMSLIESIIHGYYYPPIILNLTNGNYNCIDGKQRITSILKFLNNEIYYSLNDKEIYFNDFDEQSKESFLNRQFQTCLYQDLDYDIELEIFRRVQKGEPMSKMEIMRSYNPELICNIIEKIDKYKIVWKKYNIKTLRDNYLNYILRVLLMEYKKDKGFITLTIPEIEKFVKNYDNIKDNNYELNFYNNLNKLFNFLIEYQNKLKRQDKPLTILEFILLYKMILNNELNKYYKCFIKYYELNCINKNNMTSYIPSILNKIYNIDLMKIKIE